jgi:putative (di)nucleoside polyphosphate hydrolase
MRHVVVFKRGVYASALRHLEPFGRQIAGAQAIPLAQAEARATTGGRAARTPPQACAAPAGGGRHPAD